MKRKKSPKERVTVGRIVVVLEKELGIIVDIDYTIHRKTPYLVESPYIVQPVKKSSKKLHSDYDEIVWYARNELIILPRKVTENQLKALEVLLR